MAAAEELGAAMHATARPSSVVNKHGLSPIFRAGNVERIWMVSLRRFHTLQFMTTRLFPRTDYLC